MKGPDEELVEIFKKNGIKVDLKKSRKGPVKIRAGKRVIELEPDGSTSEYDDNDADEINSKKED